MKLTDCSRRLMCAAVVALGCVAVPLFAQQGPFGIVPTWGLSWALHGSMPFERSEATAAVVNDKVYLISGNSRGNEANSLLQEYDPATDAWRDRALMPSVASHAGAAALNGKIYVVGGFVERPVGAVSRVFEYDLTRSMARVAPLSARADPQRRGLERPAAAIGGRDPKQKTWRRTRCMTPRPAGGWRHAPEARDHLGIAVAGGRPRLRRTTVATVGKTGPTTCTTRRRTAGREPRRSRRRGSAGATFVLDGHVYAAASAGTRGRTTFTDVEAYVHRPAAGSTAIRA